jgi:hypothetical protein
MTWYEKWAIMVIAAAIGVAGYNGIPWHKMDVAIWAYWVGAIGSIGSIAGAYFLGERQARASLHMIANADRLDAYRKGKAILAVTNAAQANASQAMEAFYDNGFDYLILTLNYDAVITRSLIESLANIPVHELGSYNAVAAFLRIRTAMGHLQKHLKRCMDQAEGARDKESGAVKNGQLFDVIPIRLCMEDIIKSNKVLTREVEMMGVA